jgi:hypothetical protein
MIKFTIDGYEAEALKSQNVLRFALGSDVTVLHQKGM